MSTPSQLPGDFFDAKPVEAPAQLTAGHDFGDMPQLVAAHPAEIVDREKLANSLVASHVLSIPATTVYHNSDLVDKQLQDHGIDAPNTIQRIASDIKAGAEGSIFGLAYRGKMPDTLQHPEMMDKFITGLSQMVADLPFYLGGLAVGTTVGGVAGSAVPVVGNVAGAAGGGAMGTFAVPAAIRESLVLGIQKGDIKSFGDLVSRILSAMYAGEKGALTGLAMEAGGAVVAPLGKALGPATGAATKAMKLLQQAAAIEITSKAVEGQLPDANDFAINVALMAAMHFTVGGMEKATELAPKLQAKVQDAYVESGMHPREIAAEALRLAQSDPTEDVVGRLNEITRTQPVEAGTETAQPEVAKEETGGPKPVPEAAKDGSVIVPEGDSTGIKNASVDAHREAMGLPPIESPTRSLDPNNWENAKADVDSGKIDPLAIAQSINDNPRGLSGEETNALNYYRARLSNEHKVAMDTIERARANGDIQAEQDGRDQLQGIEDRINTVDTATKAAGTEWGLTGNMRQRTVAEDYSLDRLIQRARVASPTGEVAPEIRDRLEVLTRQLDIANKRLDEYQEGAAQREADRVVTRIKDESVRAQRRDARKQERVALDEEFSTLVKDFDSLIMGRMSANPFLDPEVLGVVGKMAKNRVESGITHIEDIVDSIHAKLTDLGHDVEKRDIRDAISGYGRTIEMSKDAINVALREAKRQGKLFSALEDAQEKLVPLKSGLQRDKVSERVKELQKQVKEAMRESGVDTKADISPEDQWRTALDSVKTRLRTQIDNLTKQLETGEKETKPVSKVKLDAEAQALQDKADHLRLQIKQDSIEARLRLQKILEGVEGKAGISPEQKLKSAMDATQRSIDEYERRIRENDISPAKRKAGVRETPELAALRDRRDALAETFKQMKDAAKPKLSPEEVKLKRYKATLQTRIADMEQRLTTGDFNKRPQQKVVVDSDAAALQLKAAKLRGQMDNEIAKQELANRTTTEKALGFLNKWRRATLLTSWHTLGKLQSAAMLRMGVTPIEELIGGVLSQIPGIDKISDRAFFEGGGFNISAEAKAFSQFWQKATLDDTVESVKSGKTSLDLLYGDKLSLPPTALDFIGHLHGALKVIPKRAEFFRRVEKATQRAIDQNLDINDPRVQTAILARSYEFAQGSILMQKNAVTKAYQAFLSTLHSHGAGGQAIEAGARFLLPIVHVPTNFAAESLAYTPGGFLWQTFKLLHTLADKDKMGRSAMDNLTMHDMDNIMRGLKKGSLGLALLALGYALRHDVVTGYYRDGKKKQGDAALGSMKIGNTEIPVYLAESPALQALQLGATMGNVWDHFNAKGMSGGFIAGMGYGTVGIAKAVPFMDAPARIAQAMRTPESASVMAGDLTGSLMIPLLAKQIAVGRDPLADQRKAHTFTDAIKLQVPGLRETIPVGGRRHTTHRSY